MEPSQHVIEDNQALALWYFLKECNFNCSYCKIGRANSKRGITRRIRKRIKHVISPPLDPLSESGKVMQLLKNEAGKKWTIGLTGGEPFMYPNFIQLCEVLTEHFSIYVDTNLSITKRVREFVQKISPDRVAFFYISTHIVERERRKRVDDFIKNILVLQEYGFSYRVNYVLHPTLLDRFMKDFDYFQSRGVTLLPKPFMGMFQGKRYPQGYADHEKALLLKYNPNFHDEIPVKSRGIKCDAGKSFVRIAPDGKVTRCVGDKTVLGHVLRDITFYKEAEPCKIETCPCFNHLLHKHHLPEPLHFA